MTTTLTAGGPEDLLAAVPVVLGFHPADSVVMLTFDARHAFHARVDLPPPDELDDQLPELCDALRAPCLVHGVATVAFVVYSADHRLVARVGARLRRHFTAAGIGVVDLLRAHDRRWWPVPSGRREQGRGGRPYDAFSHPFAVQSVFEGQVTHASRDDLRATLAGDPEGQARVTACQRRLGPRWIGEAARVPWVLDVLGRWVETRGHPDDEDAARLLLAVRRPEARDAALFAVSRETARDHLRVWSGLLRRAPREQVPAAAVVTAFAAWQSGHGALAWCALDRCLEVEPDHTLARALAECLTHAVPPSAWEEIAAASTTEPGTR